MGERHVLSTFVLQAVDYHFHGIMRFDISKQSKTVVMKVS